MWRIALFKAATLFPIKPNDEKAAQGNSKRIKIKSPNALDSNRLSGEG